MGFFLQIHQDLLGIPGADCPFVVCIVPPLKFSFYNLIGLLLSVFLNVECYFSLSRNYCPQLSHNLFDPDISSLLGKGCIFLAQTTALHQVLTTKVSYLKKI